MFATQIGGGLSGYVALRKDNLGLITRSVTGKAANKVAIGTYKFTQNVDESLSVTEKVKEAVQKASKRVSGEIKKQF